MLVECAGLFVTAVLPLGLKVPEVRDSPIQTGPISRTLGRRYRTRHQRVALGVRMSRMRGYWYRYVDGCLVRTLVFKVAPIAMLVQRDTVGLVSYPSSTHAAGLPRTILLIEGALSWGVKVRATASI